jgi:LysR family hydrogen peroxide-inducible transcriptional activator
MNLRDLKYLIAVSEHLNFGKAAEACNVSQPTLSMQIKKLEEYLRLSIFERSNKSVMLTDYGHEIVKMARGIIAGADDLVAYSKSCRDPLAGDFRLGAFPTVAPYFLPKIIAPIKKAMPNLHLFLMEEKSPILIEKLLNGEIDAAILAFPIENDTLATKTLFEDNFRLAVPISHNLANNKTVTMEDINNESLLLLEDGHCLRNQALQVCSLSGAKETAGFRATSLETLRQMVAAGSGITLIPQIAISSHKDKLISYIPFSGIPPSRTIGIVWRKSSPRFKVVEKILSTQLHLR